MAETTLSGTSLSYAKVLSYYKMSHGTIIDRRDTPVGTEIKASLDSMQNLPEQSPLNLAIQSTSPE